MRFHVGPHQRLRNEPLLANGARKRSFAGMRGHDVRFDATALREAHTAGVALVRLLLLVRHFMHVQRAFPHEPFTANLALVRLLARVRPHVVFEIRLFNGGPAANLAVVEHLFMKAVLVALQPLRVQVDFIAQLAGKRLRRCGRLVFEAFVAPHAAFASERTAANVAMEPNPFVHAVVVLLAFKRSEIPLRAVGAFVREVDLVVFERHVPHELAFLGEPFTAGFAFELAAQFHVVHYHVQFHAVLMLEFSAANFARVHRLFVRGQMRY